MTKVTKHRIRPAGRHLMTIGRDLIQNQHAAIVELVKNSYDADSPDVYVIINADSDHVEITVRDSGHGMTYEDVVEKWLVPSTTSKLKNPKSPKNRVVQGRKGVGRYSALLLGEKVSLTTTVKGGETVSVDLEWDDFRNKDYLDQVVVNVAQNEGAGIQGTSLTMDGGSDFLSYWNHDSLKSLKKELRKLLSPFDDFSEDGNKFEIFLTIKGFGEDDVEKLKLEALPFHEHYDYKISGAIDSNGIGTLQYKNTKIANVPTEEIQVKLGGVEKPLCGSLIFDIRVFDREPADIIDLVEKISKAEKVTLGRNEARKKLTEFSGIGVYRNGFRIRPLGDSGFDWLSLDSQRVQNPTLKIGSNQVMGYIIIESEKKSGLYEKTARDGLLENDAYHSLQRIADYVINELESRRYRFRRMVQKKKSNVPDNIISLLSLDELHNGIKDTLKKENVSDEGLEVVSQLVEKAEEKHDKIFKEFQKTLAVYQGQATVGRVVNVLLHEGRRSLSYFNNNVEFLSEAAERIIEEQLQEDVEELQEIAEGFERNSKQLTELFKKIDPLATGVRGKPSAISFNDVVEDVVTLFKRQLDEKGIEVDVELIPLKVQGWRQDFNAIVTNIVDNSIYWLERVDKVDRKITIASDYDAKGKLSRIIFRDNGPGIDAGLVKDESIFEPDFTTKRNGEGTGLGLAIAGEAASRNNFVLKAYEYADGAYFGLEVKGEGDGQTTY